MILRKHGKIKTCVKCRKKRKATDLFHGYFYIHHTKTIIERETILILPKDTQIEHMVNCYLEELKTTQKSGCVQK